MANKYLNDTGLAYFFGKLKGIFVQKESGKGLSTNDFTTTEKTKLSGIETGAEVNQNAFSNVSVGSTTISADSKTDTLTLTAGDNVTLTPDTQGNITIDSSYVDTNTTYEIIYTETIESPLKVTPSLYDSNGSDWDILTIYDEATTDTSKYSVYTANTVNNLISGSGGGIPSSTTPKMDGTAAVGSETAYARGDHVHPKDTSKADLASPTFTGTPTAPTAAVGTSTTQIATTAFVANEIANIDMSAYMKTTDMVAITTAEIDALFS